MLDSPSLVVRKEFTMNMFSESKEMLPPFRDFFKHKHEEKQHRCVRDDEITTNMCLCQCATKEIFNPINQTKVDTHVHMTDIAKKVVEAFVKELRDHKKTTHVHLSSMNGELSWEQATDEYKDHVMNVSVVNEPCKSTFGVATEDVNQHANIGLKHTGGIAMSKKNGDFATVHKKKSRYSESCVMFISF